MVCVCVRTCVRVHVVYCLKRKGTLRPMTGNNNNKHNDSASSTITVYQVFCCSRFLPVVGMVTILMNDYPMLKASNKVFSLYVCYCASWCLQYALLGGLGVFVLLNRE